jgi:hypothetical protein
MIEWEKLVMRILVMEFLSLYHIRIFIEIFLNLKEVTYLYTEQVWPWQQLQGMALQKWHCEETLLY